ncbi:MULTISPECIES: TrbI/VirB10 family protein [unclassified Mesorhizobium]|uniref:TrbI/VirB10 family protein n=1 Tax=unclassified Mesorhizobium TaxID=325217 RepID=UPI000F765804|nr:MULTISPECIES: TrbI/VirB10 family protein [unclassified Mesorhizobium]AZO05124.1 TrbI/VirB10 family protein [Mesorhizobium sp. M2A.F.Ca.ET.043.02.1.1]RWB42909.1 MAG: TrbI/VirB10 family protein [Mesorhizobium sp.]RWB64912.1 MAG: TrbI/VirB10 family protein [Mesorhizobium sp.]RWB88128.1 MAG: TrbI/VirB10 family protein [Mesorhizobium sp.]RWD77336.1 MAG: TrbI/VirB10 family protein [Mesorhizobium sp.]
MSEAANISSQDLRTDLRLRPAPARVMRLSRKVLVGLGGVASIAIVGALVWALDSRRRDNELPSELFTTENRSTADGLQALPKDYAGVPKLGPALPGDLGRPILRAQEQGRPVAAAGISAPHVDPEEQRRLAEVEAARVAKLFAGTNMRTSSGRQGTVAEDAMTSSLASPATSTGQPQLDTGARQNSQDRKLAFVNAEPDRRTASPDRVARKASPYVVQAGSVIPAALITGIRSDLPGQIAAQVTENVYDSPTGSYLLIPQAAKLIGQYDSQVAFGQSRVLLVWNRLIMPDGSSIVLERQQGADAEGFSGLEDEVDHHWGQLFQAAALSTLLGIGTSLGSSSDESDIAKAIREGAQDSVSNVGRQIVGRQLDVQPTLTVRPGFPVRVIVNRDLVLAPYGTVKAPS